jgi:hypothetical protein
MESQYMGLEKEPCSEVALNFARRNRLCVELMDL